MILFQIFFFIITVGSAFFGLPIFLTVVIGSLLFTFGNVFTAPLMIIQTSVIGIASIIGFFIAIIISIKKASEEGKLKENIRSIVLIMFLLCMYEYNKKVLFIILISVVLLIIIKAYKDELLKIIMRYKYKATPYILVIIIIGAIIPQIRNLVLHRITPGMLREEINIVKEFKFNKSDQDQKYGLVDEKGNIIVKPEYSSITKMEKGLFLVEKEWKYGVINDEGKMIVELKYDKPIDQIEDGMLVVPEGANYHTLLDPYGNYISKLPYELVFDFEDGYAIVRSNFKYGMIDSKAEVVLEPEYDDISDFYGEIKVISKDLKKGLINKKGEIILEPVYNTITSVFNGVSVIKKNNLYGVIDSRGNILFEPQFDYIYDINFKSGTSLVLKDGKVGTINNEGEIVEALTVENKLELDWYIDRY